MIPYDMGKCVPEIYKTNRSRRNKKSPCEPWVRFNNNNNKYFIHAMYLGIIEEKKERKMNIK